MYESNEPYNDQIQVKWEHLPWEFNENLLESSLGDESGMI